MPRTSPRTIRRAIEIEGAREHNLRGVSARIPLGSFTVVTGPSGSGKSTLAFDIVFASGQSRYLECISAYARQFVQPRAKPDVLALRNLPPTVAIQQRLSRGGWKSTVATATELLSSLRLLFLALGKTDEPAGEPEPGLFSFNTARGRCPRCLGFGFVPKGAPAPETKPKDREGRRYEERSFADVAAEDEPPAFAAEDAPVCPLCGGSRLSPEALSYRWHGRSIADFLRMTVTEMAERFDAIQPTERERAIADGPLRDIRSRLGFLRRVGLGYLSLDRAVPTLSGGESQRIRLAAQLGSNLCGVCYVLDEPTIGLHPRDTAVLLDTLVALRDKGNTVVVVEHDLETMRRADWICDLGPGAGTEGGRLLAEGPLDAILACPESKTARALLAKPPVPSARPRKSAEAIVLRRCSLHNLRIPSVSFPTGAFTVVTGVSGSGKSTLVRDVLFRSLRPLADGGKPEPVGCASIEIPPTLRRALEVDQTPIGRTPRSCPATYVGFWDDVRRLFAASPEARLRGWGPDRFSFNVQGGRCPACEGQGVIRTEMAFLPDVVSECDVCHGARFNPETLQATWHGKTIADVLRMSVAEALAFFADIPSLVAPLTLLRDVGLGYLSLGQQSSTLSGGEAQRIKLVYELAKCATTGRVDRRTPHTLYVLDEPTVGLHASDVSALLTVLRRLVDAGHTIVCIEHNVDVMLAADHLIDLGPEGGPSGGRIVARGAPAALLADPPPASLTARLLADQKPKSGNRK